jgi:hypothetical protein
LASRAPCELDADAVEDILHLQRPLLRRS